MIPVCMILLAIQHFQHRSGRIAPVVSAHLVHLVQQEQRVHGLGLNQAVDDPSGHGAHVGLPMTTDLGLIPNTAQTDPGHVPVQGTGNGICNRGLTHAGRAHQTQDLGRHRGSHLTDSQRLQNPLLYLFKAVVILLQNFPCSLDVDTFFGAHIPGQLQYDIQVVPEHRTLGGAERLLGKALHVLQELLLLFFSQLQILDLLPVGIHFALVVALAQLIADGLQLFPEVVVPMALIHALAGLVLDVQLNGQHINLPGKQFGCQIQTLGGRELIQELHLVRIVKTNVLGQCIGQEAGIGGGHHLQLELLSGMLRHLQISAERHIHIPDDSTELGGQRIILLMDHIHPGQHMGFRLDHVADLGAIHTGDQHPHGLILGTQNLLDPDNSAQMIELIRGGIVHHNIFLRSQKQNLISIHGVFNGLHRLLPCHIKVDCLHGIDHNAPQGQYGHLAGYDNFFHKDNPLLSDIQG